MKAELEKIYHLGQAVRGSHGFFMEYYGKVTCRQKNKRSLWKQMKSVSKDGSHSSLSVKVKTSESLNVTVVFLTS